MKKLTQELLALTLVLMAHTAAAQLDSPMPGAGATAFTHANILTMNTPEPIHNATIMVNGGRIEAILPPGATVPAHYDLVDLDGRWVIPGLIDGHVHLNQSGSAFSRPDIIDATGIVAYADEQDWLQAALPSLLGSYIEAGVTTVVDMGGPSSWLADYRRFSGNDHSPQIHAAAELLSAVAVPQLDDDGPVFLPVTTETEALAEVERQVGLPVDVVKFVWTDESGRSPAELAALFQAAMEKAGSTGRTVAVHVEDLDYAKSAIRAGADILVHGVMTGLIDEEFISLARQYKVAYMPTLTAHQHYKDIFRGEVAFSDYETRQAPARVTASFAQLVTDFSLTGEMFQILSRYMPFVDDQAGTAALSRQEQSIVAQLSALFSSNTNRIQSENLKRAAHAGLRLAFGTDAGNPGTVHGASVFGEMSAWLAARISVERLLQAMTRETAEAFGIAAHTGVLASGRTANFIVFDSSPMSAQLPHMRPSMVVKSGRVVLDGRGGQS